MLQFWLLFTIGNRKGTIIEWIGTFWIRIGTTVPAFYAQNWKNKNKTKTNYGMRLRDVTMEIGIVLFVSISTAHNF